MFNLAPVSGDTIAISNMTIKGGSVAGCGGSITHTTAGNLTLSGVTITGSKASSSDGGGGISFVFYYY